MEPLLGKRESPCSSITSSPDKEAVVGQPPVLLSKNILSQFPELLNAIELITSNSESIAKLNINKNNIQNFNSTLNQVVNLNRNIFETCFLLHQKLKNWLQNKQSSDNEHFMTDLYKQFSKENFISNQNPISAGQKSKKLKIDSTKFEAKNLVELMQQMDSDVKKMRFEDLDLHKEFKRTGLFFLKQLAKKFNKVHIPAHHKVDESCEKEASLQEFKITNLEFKKKLRSLAAAESAALKFYKDLNIDYDFERCASFNTYFGRFGEMIFEGQKEGDFIYEGGYLNQNFHGFAKLLINNKDPQNSKISKIFFYEGEFSLGLPHGYGRLITVLFHQKVLNSYKNIFKIKEGVFNHSQIEKTQIDFVCSEDSK